MTNCCRLIVVAGVLFLSRGASAAADWQDNAHRAVLRNKFIEAKFQAGQLYEMTDRASGELLLSNDPRQFPNDIPLFGNKGRVDLGAFGVSQQTRQGSIQTTYTAPDGMQWYLAWSIEPTGDLKLRTSAKTASPVEEFRSLFLGCDITRHSLVWIHSWGVGHVANAPWEDAFLGDPLRGGSPLRFSQPLVVLFQGDSSGWFVEGREERVGPACVLVKGSGNQATLGMVRRFPQGTCDPAMYEIRIRTYKDQWENAVDPYVEWLEKGAGLVPIAKLPAKQAWVKDIKTQAYVDVGDFDSLDALAKRLDPAKTLVGRQAGFRGLPMGKRYPDYRLTDVAKRWVKRVRELGFHVGLHFNCNAVTTDFPELVERFNPGFAITGKDADGNDTYESLRDGYFIRCSPAYRPWREYLIEQMKEAVDCGVDVIYLDESMGPTGKFVVDGVDGVQGLMLLMKEILEAYPHVAIETEQFNTLSAKYGKFALSQMPLGHPLGGYIFRPFVKVVPEGVMCSPIDSSLMDAFDCWGFMLPGGEPYREETWVQIAEAYQKYDLVPDGSLPRKQLTHVTKHWTGGVVPTNDAPAAADGEKLFGLRGSNGVTAYFERHATKRGLVIREPGQEPKWVGTRHFGIKSWSGPGVPSYFGFRNYLRDWLIYDETSLLGLDPKMTYMFDESVVRSPSRFHVTEVPDDFVGYTDMERRITPQEVGRHNSFFRLVFAGHGKLSMHVPDDYDVYLDGRKLDVDRRAKTASATISASLPEAASLGYFIQFAPDDKPVATASEERPSMLLAFRRSETELAGKLVDLHWQQSKDTSKWVQRAEDSFTMNVGAFVIFIGKLPQSENIRLEGSYEVSTFSAPPGDGVVLINGKQVFRVPSGDPLAGPRDFTFDLSSYAGEHVIMEIIPDGPVRGATAKWLHPSIGVGR